MNAHTVAQAIFALTVATSSASGQVVPGSRSRAEGSVRAEFLDAVLRGLRPISTAWVDAWAEDDPENAARLYSEETLVVTPEGQQLVGRGDVLDYLMGAVPRFARLETFLTDFDASNNMAMTVERYVLTPASPGASQEVGLLLTVYLNDGDSWKIRTQVFRPRAPAEGGAAQGAGSGQG
jgi:ketosteroid isomerase-like protein